MRLLPFVLTLALAVPLSARAQEPVPDTVAARSRAPVVSLTFYRSLEPRIGIWKNVSDRVALGLEVDAGSIGWRHFPAENPGDPTSGRDWRFAVGPSVAVRLASTGSARLYAMGGVSWGTHRFPTRASVFSEPFERPDPVAGLGARLGVGLDWQVSDRWTVGALHSLGWTRDPGDRVDFRPGLGLVVKFRF